MIDVVKKNQDEPHSPQALEGIVVLDIAGPLCGYCGKMFADLGATVILIEPAEGAASRHRGPFNKHNQGADSSLLFQYLNTNKKSLVLDLDTAEGQNALKKLAANANLIIESEGPGRMQSRGLGYEQLKEASPSLVMLSLSAFGQDGPYAHWQGSDLIAMAMGGMLYLAGYKDTAPMVAYGEQGVGAANLFGAVAALAAVLRAELFGQGQHIDLSMQQSAVMGMENAAQFYDLQSRIRTRNAGEQRSAGTGVFTCKDGYIYLMAGGVGGNRFWPVTTQWLVDEGVEGAHELQKPQWLDTRYLATAEAKKKFLDVFQRFASQLTKAELQQKGRDHRIPIAPINDASALDSDQRKHRKYFVDVDTADGQNVKMPGAPYVLSETPWAITRPAPKLGQHSVEILDACGFNPQEINSLLQAGE